VTTERIRPRNLGLLVALLLAVPSCTDPDPEAPGEFICRLSVSHLADLGHIEDPISITGQGAVHVSPLGENGWAVLQPGMDIVMYAHDGRYLGVMGTRGEGPLELTAPMSMAAGPGDSIWVSHRSGWLVFAADGTPAREVPTPGSRSIDGFTPSGIAFKLYAAGVLQPDGAVRASLYVRRWPRDPGAPALDPVGPGVADLDRGARVARAAYSDLVVPVTDTTFLVVGNWEGDAPAPGPPGSPGVMEWTPSSTRMWTSPGTLEAAVRVLGAPAHPYLVMRAIDEVRAGDGYWVFAGLQRVSADEQARLEEEHGGGPWRYAPLIKNRIFDGVVWKLDSSGALRGLATFDEFPDGVAGPDQFFTITEEEATGLRTVRIYAVEGC
jgi:hypothetical protein